MMLFGKSPNVGSSRAPGAYASGSLIVAGAILLLLLFTTPTLHAQQQKKKVVPWEGTQAFQYLLFLFGQQPIQKIDDLKQLNPKETTIVVFGDPKSLEKINAVRRLKQFTDEGGALLAAIDRNDRLQLRDYDIRISGWEIRQENRENRYRGQRDCPLVVRGTKTPHPIFNGVTKGIATNHPSLISLKKSNLHILAQFSEPYTTEPPRGQGRFFRGNNADWRRFQRAFAASRKQSSAFIAGTAGDTGPENRIVIVAGHGVFMNGMMAQYDNDNFLFAYNTLNWLTNTGRPGQERKHVLFVAENKVVQSFDVPLTELPKIPMPTVQIINALLYDWQQEGFYDTLLDKALGMMRLNRGNVLQILLIAFTSLLLLLGLVRLVRSYNWRESGVPSSAPLVAARQPDLPLIAQRQRMVLAHGKMGEAIRQLAQEWFASLPGGERARRSAPRLTGMGRSQSQWQASIDRLWQLAYGNRLELLRRRDLRATLTEISEIDTALKSGRLHLDWNLPEH